MKPTGLEPAPASLKGWGPALVYGSKQKVEESNPCRERHSGFQDQSHPMCSTFHCAEDAGFEPARVSPRRLSKPLPYLLGESSEMNGQGQWHAALEACPAHCLYIPARSYFCHRDRASLERCDKPFVAPGSDASGSLGLLITSPRAGARQATWGPGCGTT